MQRHRASGGRDAPGREAVLVSRDARVSGAAPEGGLVRRCLQLWLRAVEARDGEAPDPGMGERVLAKFSRPLVRLAVLGGTETPTGFALTTAAASPTRSAYLELLAVDPSQQGTGAGRALLDDAIAAARRQGYARFELDVRYGNTRAIGLYESRGMVATGTRPTSHALPGGPMISFELLL